MDRQMFDRKSVSRKITHPQFIWGLLRENVWWTIWNQSTESM